MGFHVTLGECTNCSENEHGEQQPRIKGLGLEFEVWDQTSKALKALCLEVWAPNIGRRPA